MKSMTKYISAISYNSKKLNRRQFLRRSTVASVALITSAAYAQQPSRRIEHIDLFAVRYPTKGYFKFFVGPGGMYGRSAVIIKITGENGKVGWGQSIPSPMWSYETLETVKVVLRDYLGPVLIGRNPLDIIGAHKAMDRALAPGFSTAMPIARSGLDMALHDLTGKLRKQSLSQMWNRARGGSLTLSWTVNARTLSEAEVIIDTGYKRGYSNFNIKVAPDPKFDLDLARIVRRRAPDGFLWADANGGYDEATALEAAPKLADVGIDVLEAPLRPNHIRGYQALKKQGALPILMDEGIVSPVELIEFIRLKMLDGVAMKPSRCGGLLPAKQQIDILLDEGLIWLGSGLTDPDISTAAAVALYGAYGLTKPAALNGPQFLTTDVLAKPLNIENDSVTIPSGHGLGVDVDESKVVKLMKETTKSERIKL
jgi:L-alanine-DL-glutamate epimerase-like enolase superfamily enzyme